MWLYSYHDNNYALIVTGIVDTYKEMTKDELKPNALTHYLAGFGYLQQEVGGCGFVLGGGCGFV